MPIGGRFLLDTNILIAILVGEKSALSNLKMAAAVYVPAGALGALYFGAAKSRRRRRMPREWIDLPLPWPFASCCSPDLLQAALGDGNAGQAGNGLDRFQERVPHGGRERTGRQDKFPVRWKDAGRARAGVAHAEEFARCLLEAQREPRNSVTAKLQVGLVLCRRGRRPQSSAVLERKARRFLELKRDLELLEYFCKGTVLKRMMKRGKANCACASDPATRLGPYYEITYKTNGKTVNVKLLPEAAPLYKAASLRYRKLKTLLHSLEKPSQSILRLQAKLAQSNRHT